MFSSLKVDSDRRKKEQRKTVYKLGKINITKRKVLDSVVENHKPFSSAWYLSKYMGSN